MTDKIRIHSYDVGIPAAPSDDYVISLRHDTRGLFASLSFKAGASRADIDFDGEVYRIVFDSRRYHDILELLGSGKPAFLQIDNGGASVHVTSAIDDEHGWPATFD